MSSRPSSSVTDRTLHLADLDNLVGGPWNPHRVPTTMANFLAAAALRSGDHLVVAAEKALAKTALFQMPREARFLIGTGPNGADLKLLDAVPVELIARCYTALVIGSGDGCFEVLARQARDLGVHVTVVSNRDTLSRRLAAAADLVVPLSPLVSDVSAAVAPATVFAPVAA